MFLFEAFSWFMTSQSHNWESCYSCFLAQLSHFIQVCLKMSYIFVPNVTDIFGEVKYFDNFISFWHIPLRNIFFSFWRLSPEVPLLRCCRGVRTICYLGEPNFSLHWQLLIMCSNEKLLFLQNYETLKCSTVQWHQMLQKRAWQSFSWLNNVWEGIDRVLCWMALDLSIRKQDARQ